MPPVLYFTLDDGIQQQIGLRRASWNVICWRRALHVIADHLVFGTVVTAKEGKLSTTFDPFWSLNEKNPTIAENVRHNEYAAFCMSCSPFSTLYDSFESVQSLVVALFKVEIKEYV